MSEETVLEEAYVAVSHRREEYGSPAKNMDDTALLWSAYLHGKYGFTKMLDGEDVAHMMTLIKIARTMSEKAGRDTYVDIAGYADVAYECKTSGIGSDTLPFVRASE